jgi:hypothetical protein
MRFLTLKEGLRRFIILVAIGAVAIEASEVPWRTLWLTLLTNLQISP